MVKRHRALRCLHWVLAIVLVSAIGVILTQQELPDCDAVSETSSVAELPPAPVVESEEEPAALGPGLTDIASPISIDSLDEGSVANNPPALQREESRVVEVSAQTATLPTLPLSLPKKNDAEHPTKRPEIGVSHWGRQSKRAGEEIARPELQPAEGKPVEPAAKIGDQVTQISFPKADDQDVNTPAAGKQPSQPVAGAAPVSRSPAEKSSPVKQSPAKLAEGEIRQPALLPEWIQRLPAMVADFPAKPDFSPAADPTSDERYRDTGEPATPPSPSAASKEVSSPPQPKLDDSWQEPTALIDSLRELSGSGPAGKWAADALREIAFLGPAMARGSDDATAIVKRLAELCDRVPLLAESISDPAASGKLRRAGYALARRIDTWLVVARLPAESRSEPNSGPDPEKLKVRLAEIEAITTGAAEGRAWRDYLLIEPLSRCVSQWPATADGRMRELAQQALVRHLQTPLSREQQQFVTSRPVAALRTELWHWAAEPIGAAALLRDVERFEHTGLPSDGRRLALDCQFLMASSCEARRELAAHVDAHYRNANARVTFTERLLNSLMPERNLEYARVNHRVLSYPTRGESLMATEGAVRMMPDPTHVRVALEIRGKIAALTVTDAGPARFHNASQSYYIARKPMEIDMHGIRLWPVQVQVHNETEVRDVNTSLDGVPIVSWLARHAAETQMEMNKSAAKQDVEEKIAAEVRDRVDDEVRKQLAGVVERLNKRVFDPLNSLALDPQMIAGETTDTRFTMRLRLAGEDQPGSYTPRPVAPSDSLASVQIHESIINNGILRLQLAGNTFTLPELSQHVATCLSCPTPWKVNPDNEDVKVTFAKKDPVVVHCQDGQVVITLSIDRLSKSPRKWTNFQVRAFYEPQVNGRSAQLVREGVIHLSGPRLTTGAQIALRGIFSHAFSKKVPWELVPAQIVNEPKLKDAAITQLVIEDGWLGVSLGPKRAAVLTAHKQRHSVQ